MHQAQCIVHVDEMRSSSLFVCMHVCMGLSVLYVCMYVWVFMYI